MLQLLVDEVPVGLVRGHVWVLQAGARSRVQHGNIPLKDAASRRHLVFVMDVLEFLSYEEGEEGGFRGEVTGLSQ